ncbi:MAG: hypothetical protein QM831_38095 [Kofleriaceae bacterium]
MGKKLIAASLCAFSACTLVSKFQTGGGPSSSGAPGGSSSGPVASSSGSAPAIAEAPASGGGGSYCGHKHYSKYTAKDLHRWWDDNDEERGRYAMHFVVKLHQALCSPDTPAADRPEIENMRKSLLAELGITDADTRDLPTLLDADMTDTPPSYFWFATEHPTTEGNAKASTTSAVDQMYLLTASENWFYKTRWLVDAWGDQLTEGARASYIRKCLHAGRRDKLADKAVNYAWCSDDVKQLDRAKFNKELEPLKPALRFTAKFELGMLMREVAATEKELAKDPKLAKVAIETPRKIGDDWRAFAKANRGLVDHVRAVELAWIDDKHAADDCRTTLAADWKKAVASTAVIKELAPSQNVAQSSRASYLASVGMARCTHRMDGFDGLSQELAESIARAPMQRGPRTEAFEAAVTALSTKRDPIETPRMESEDVSFLPMAQVNDHTPRFHAHTVAAVEKHGDKQKLKFKKEKVDYAVCTREEPTGNWIIHGNKIERETHCVSIKAESAMEEVEPIEVPADLMPWVKPGNAVVLGSGKFPIEIWTDVHQTKLIGLYGTNRS